MAEHVTILTAFIAGIVSFLSPCVLPLVPGYISMLSGMGVEQLQKGEKPQGQLLASAGSFILGFSIVFIAFGASASAIGQFLVQNKALMAPVAGAVILLFGLHLIGWLVKIPVKVGLAVGALLVAGAIAVGIRPALGGGYVEPVHFASLSLIFLGGPFLSRWLNRDVRFRNVGGKPGVASGFLMGFAFAFGWTPCIGPILAAVLTLAATEQTVMRGVGLLAVYSAGLALPFFLTALGISRFLNFYRRFRRHLYAVEVFSGVLLLLVGGLIYLNRLTWLSGKLSFLNTFSR
jgi:cytochrome c-type biogenesis protein